MNRTQKKNYIKKHIEKPHLTRSQKEQSRVKVFPDLQI
jgi:hypothetical protein